MFVSFKKNISPKYTNVGKTLDILQKRKRSLAMEYYDMYDQLVHDSAKVKPADLNKVAESIHSLQKEIDQLVDFKTLQQHHSSSKQDSIANSLAEIQRMEDDIYKQAMPVMHAASLASMFKEKLRLHKELKASRFDDLVTDEFIVDSSRTDEVDAPEDIKPPLKNKKKTTKKLTNVQVENVSKTIKSLIASKYRFKTQEECLSKQRTKDFYASKEQIISIVDSTPELKKLMPANYKKLTKDKLCEVFFSKNGAR